MKIFGKTVILPDNPDDLDMGGGRLILWEPEDKTAEIALSVEEDKARKDKADKAWSDKAALEGRKTIICDDFWEDFVLITKVCLLRNADADLYDVFETIRTKFLGGWGYTDASILKLDAEIALEEARGLG
jgi:hypothetical protein